MSSFYLNLLSRSLPLLPASEKLHKSHLTAIKLSLVSGSYGPLYLQGSLENMVLLEYIAVLNKIRDLQGWRGKSTSVDH